MIKVVKKLNSEQCDDVRQRVIQTVIAPAALAVFKKYRRLKSCVLFLSQYYVGEDLDAIQFNLIYSLSERPDIQKWYKAIDDLTMTESENFYLTVLEGREGAKIARVVYDADGHPDIWYIHGKQKVFDRWAEQAKDIIPAFSAYTSENGREHGPYDDNFFPFALLKRPKKASKNVDLDIEIIGEMRRPWLDGVMPLAEQLEGDYPETEAYSDSLGHVSPESEREIGPVRLEKTVWSKAESVTGKAYLGVQNALDKWAEEDAKPEEPISEFDVLKGVLAILFLVFLIMSIMTLAGIPISTE